MAKVLVFFRDEQTGKLKRKRFQGQEVDYKESDAVLGGDFINIRVDNHVLAIRKENVVHLYIEK